MRTTRSVLKEYAGADEEQRLYLFLSHRELRQEFVAIDAADRHAAKAAALSSKASAISKTPFSWAAGCCQGWLKYCRWER